MKTRSNFLLVTSHQLLVSSRQLLVTSHQLLVTSYQSLVTSHQLLVTSHQLLVTSYQSLVASHELLVNNVSGRNNIFQGYSREMFGGVLCLLMLIFLRKLKKMFLFYLSDTCFNLRVLEVTMKSCSTQCSLISEQMFR